MSEYLTTLPSLMSSQLLGGVGLMFGIVEAEQWGRQSILIMPQPLTIKLQGYQFPIPNARWPCNTTITEIFQADRSSPYAPFPFSLTVAIYLLSTLSRASSVANNTERKGGKVWEGKRAVGMWREPTGQRRKTHLGLIARLLNWPLEPGICIRQQANRTGQTWRRGYGMPSTA
ncbi:uncharacterized protein B0T15DRAFT_173109 [Chaetomium strumarium]|uniref:Uncharacterized protein n=1 Tax=Chaetomium strumarium TaxID=1170767 RepID=A0AAJ0M345_9PEZI|nr:hypothetical protein B0T15DRAFT_173109 [Chaetomium strumarium]